MNVRSIGTYVCITVAACCFLGTLYYTYRYFAIKHNTIRQATQQLKQALDQSKKTFEENLYIVEQSMQQASTQLSTANMNDSSIDSLLKNHLQQIGILMPRATAVAYQPFEHDAQHRLWSLSYILKNNVPTKIFIKYDYTLPSLQANASTEWYNEALMQGAHWGDPYFSTSQQLLVLVYSVPFFKITEKKQKISGIFAKTFDLHQLSAVIRELSVGNAGAGFAITTNGTSIAAPPKTMPQKYVNEFVIYAQKNISGTYNTIDTAHGERAVILYHLIPRTKIIIGVYFLTSELLATTVNLLRQIILLIIFLSISTIIALLIMLMLNNPTHKIIQNVCITISMLLFCAILFTWYLEITSKRRPPVAESLVLRSAMAKKILTQISSEEGTKQPTTFIKTGVNLTTIDYTGNQVLITGMVWQRYPIKTPPIVSREILLLEIIKPFKKTLFSKTETFEDERYLWQFSGVCNFVPITPRLFPFDDLMINLSFETAPVQYPCALIPDFDAYDNINPTALPGITLQGRSPRFTLDESFFNYQRKITLYDIAPNLAGPISPDPSLCFTVVLSRSASDMLILYLIPIIVALILLYVATGLLARDTFYLTNFIGLAASVFLTLTFVQPALRRATGSNVTCYLEYYYITVYCITGALLIGSIIYTRLPVQRQKNMAEHFFWIHQLFLPTTLTIIFLFSVLIFY